MGKSEKSSPSKTSTKDSKDSKTSKASQSSDSDSKPSKGGNNSNSKLYKFKDLKINKDTFLVSDLNTEGAQDNAFVNYMAKGADSESRFMIRTSWYNINNLGIPLLDKDAAKKGYKTKGYVPDDSKREFIKIPMYEGKDSTDSCKETLAFFEAVDKYCDTDKFRSALFGPGNAKEYAYCPCVKVPEPPKNADKNAKPKGPPLRYIKAKFNMAVDQETKERTVITKIKKVSKDGSKTDVEASTVTEVASILTYKSSIRCILFMPKIWAHQTPMVKGAPKQYGLIVKMMLVHYKPGSGNLNVEDFDDFDDDSEDDADKLDLGSDDEEEEKDDKEEVSAKKDKGKDSKGDSKSSKSKPKDNSDNEEEEPKEDSEEDEPVKSKKDKKGDKSSDKKSDSKKDKKSSKKKAGSDDEDEDETIEVSAKKSSKKDSKKDKKKSSKK